MRRAIQIVGLSGIAVSLVACGSGAALHHPSAEPVSPKRVHGALLPGKVAAMDWVSGHHGWMMIDRLNRRGYVTSVVLYHTTDQGRQWQVVARYPKEDAALSALPSVSQLVFTGADHGMALAGLGVALGHTKYQLLRTTNGGRSWNPVKTLWRVSGPVAMAFSSVNRGLIVGGTGAGTPATAMKTEDGGRHWAGVPMPKPSSSRIDYPLSATTAVFSSGRDGFLVNAYWRTNAQGQLVPMLQELQTRTEGHTWKALRLPTPRGVGTVTALSFSSPTSGWVALYSLKHNQTMIESTADGGRHWRQFRGKPLAGMLGVLAQASARAGCTAMASQTQMTTQLWCTGDGGTTWFAPQL